MAVICEEHGVQKGCLVCRHIYAGIGTGTRRKLKQGERVFIDTDNSEKFYTEAVVCRACRRKMRLRKDRSVSFMDLIG